MPAAHLRLVRLLLLYWAAIHAPPVLAGDDSRALASTEAWHQLGYRQLALPHLGASHSLRLQLGNRVRLFPEVNYTLPSTEITGVVNAYEANRAIVGDQVDGSWYGYGPAVWFWAWDTQSPWGARLWDYKKLGSLEGDDLGYVNSGYTGETLFPKTFLLSGLGVIRNLHQLLTRRFDFHGPATYGIRLRSLILTEMGYDYAASRQYINDFIDAADLRSSDPEARMQAALRQSLKLSPHQEFVRRLNLSAENPFIRKDVIRRVLEQEREQEQIRKERARSIPEPQPRRSAPVPEDWGSPPGRFGPGYNSPPSNSSGGGKSCGDFCMRTRP